MNFDVHSDNIEIVKHETSVINLEEIDRIIDPRSLKKLKNARPPAKIKYLANELQF